MGSSLVWPSTKPAVEDSSKPKADLALVVSVPALGHAVYKVLRVTQQSQSGAGQEGTLSSNAGTWAAAAAPSTVTQNSSLHISNELLKLTVGPAGISSVVVTGGHAITYSSSLIKYQGSFHRSGAYVFQASGDPMEAAPTEVVVAKGPVLHEVRQRFNGVPGSLTTLLWAGQSHLEVEWTVAPPADGAGDWEAFVRYSSSVKSQGVWYTDANGREYQQRRRDYRPSFKLPAGDAGAHRLASNIYPITTGCYLQDAEAGINIAVDRAQGVVSVVDGQLDINLHRKSAGDDGKGMSQALIDQHVATGTHIVSFMMADGMQAAVKRCTARRHYEQVMSVVSCRYGQWLTHTGSATQPSDAQLLAGLRTSWTTDASMLVRGYKFQASLQMLNTIMFLCNRRCSMTPCSLPSVWPGLELRTSLLLGHHQLQQNCRRMCTC
jgi:hypothetical protein